MKNRGNTYVLSKVDPGRTGTPWLLADVLAVVVFVVVGRSAHHHASSLRGTAKTAWPFLSGTLLGWLAGRAWRAPRLLVPTGVATWLGAVLGGMALRVVSGQGITGVFVLVAALFLGLFILGWRVLVKAGLAKMTSDE
jgi:peptidoglycan/LPS O-acetylase OafA/YrhL